MGNKLRLDFVAIGFLITVLGFLVLLSQVVVMRGVSENMWTAILLDLLITLPVGYFLLIRKTKIPIFTTLYVLLLGLLIGSLIIPPAQQRLLSQIKYIVIPLAELGILAMVIYKFSSLKKSYQLKRKQEVDFYDTLLLACQEIFPERIGSLLATEISVIYYLLFPNKKRVINPTEFTYAKKSGIQLVVGVFLFLVVMETVAVHLFVAQYHNQVAWILTIVGIYAGLQIVAILRSLNQRLITIDYKTQTLKLRYGFACQTYIPFSCIKKITCTRKLLPENKGNLRLSIFDLLDTHNTIIYLNQELILYKLYGIRKKYSSIAVFIDEKETFAKAIEQIIKGDSEVD